MKITKEHYNYMKEAISSAVDQDSAKTHFFHTLPEDERVKDIKTRFRWDLSYAAKLSPWVSENIYSYANDNHLDTALKSIVKELFPFAS